MCVRMTHDIIYFPAPHAAATHDNPKKRWGFIIIYNISALGIPERRVGTTWALPLLVKPAQRLQDNTHTDRNRKPQARKQLRAIYI
jgi:hypothetical protein